MNEHFLVGFYMIEAGVCKTNRIVTDAIDRKINIAAQVTADSYGNQRECVYPPGLKTGLYPGVWAGDMPILRPSDAKL